MNILACAAGITTASRFVDGWLGPVLSLSL